jgi:hypothetical protein
MASDARFSVTGHRRLIPEKVVQRPDILNSPSSAQRNVIKVANLWFDTIQSTESELIRAPPTRRPILLSRVIS